MNTITITGRLTAEPELRKTANDVSVCNFTLAVKRPRNAEATDFIPCVVWRQGADFLTSYGHKGDIIGVVGHIQSNKYEDKEGHKRVSYDVFCDLVEILHSHNAPESARAPQSGSAAEYTDAYAEMRGDDPDLPFI